MAVRFALSHRQVQVLIQRLLSIEPATHPPVKSSEASVDKTRMALLEIQCRELTFKQVYQCSSCGRFGPEPGASWRFVADGWEHKCLTSGQSGHHAAYLVTAEMLNQRSTSQDVERPKDSLASLALGPTSAESVLACKQCDGTKSVGGNAKHMSCPNCNDTTGCLGHPCPECTKGS